MVNLVDYIPKMNIGLAIIVMLIWITYHFSSEDRQKYYWRKYEDLDRAELGLNFFRFALYLGLLVIFTQSYKNVVELLNSLELLSMLAYTLTAVECVIYGLNSIGIFILSNHFNKKFRNKK
ncbi:hypothetical protein [Paraclostridium sordellii]|uniref:hypothetical protein n=1 Tax=Paraclostridium sordellii TaxID=1505 RepID=UPI0005DDD66B|nr:hypothetical protein [Paeniclostridium sordellii]CEP39727.1 Uncharacterised protein [[Clostridium] sordellii] [Paeniclostridium sordellii]